MEGGGRVKIYGGDLEECQQPFLILFVGYLAIHMMLMMIRIRTKVMMMMVMIMMMVIMIRIRIMVMMTTVMMVMIDDGYQKGFCQKTFLWIIGLSTNCLAGSTYIMRMVMINMMIMMMLINTMMMMMMTTLMG